MDIQQLTWKMVERPLLPVENSWVDAAPFAALFILCGLTILAIFKLRRQHQPLRHLIQLAALLIFAFTFHRCFCAMRGWVFGLSEIGKDNLSLFQNTCIFIPILAFVFAFGRIFCGWICPLGFIQEGLGKINIKSKKIKIVLLCGFLAIIFFLLWRLRPVNYFVIQNAASLLGLSLLIICLTAVINPQSDTALKKIKYFYLTLWTILIIFGVFVTDPWCSIYGNEIDYSSLIGFLAVIFSGLIVSMAWCRYICPLGALFALFSKFYAYRIKDSGRADARKQDICPMHAINEKGAVDNQNCIFCLRCKGTIQKNIPLIILAILLSASPLMAADWQTFGADAQHTGTSEVNFSSQELTTSWNFSPTQHVWNYEKTSYEKGKSVWSSSIATLDVEGKKIIFTGFYDHNLYAINAQDGKNLWRYTTGGSLSAAPAAKTINGTPMVFIGSGDRTVYALDAKTGKKIWSYETEKWDYTTSEGIPSSGIIENISGKELFFICFWNNNYRLFGNIQKGEIFSFNAADGRLFWRKKLANVPLNSPALALINNKPVLLVTAHNGCLWCLDAINGQTIWYFISDASIHSSASIIKVKDKEYVVFGTRFGNIYALSIEEPQLFWKFKTGHAVDATCAFSIVNGRPLVFVGSHDRNVYCLDAETGKKVWYFATDNFITASCAIGNINGKVAVFINSLDDFLYCLDAESGRLIWKYKTGKLIWQYSTRGDTIWSSPALINTEVGPLLCLGAYDGTLYSFGDVSY